MSAFDDHGAMFAAGDYDPPEGPADDLEVASFTDYVPEVEPVEAPPEHDPVRRAWLARRERGFGASETAVLLVALGMRSPDILASYQRPEAKPIRIRLSKRSKAVAVPRIFLRKAGLRRALKPSEPMLLGIEREPELVRQWRTMVRRGTAGDAASMLDADSILYMPELGLPEILPLADAEEPRMLCTPDCTARDLFGDLGAYDGKCSFKGYGKRYGAAPEHIAIQVNTQMAILGASHGGVVEGEHWSNPYFDGPDGPGGAVRTWPVKRDDKLIGELRKAARLGWQRVIELREGAAMEAA